MAATPHPGPWCARGGGGNRRRSGPRRVLCDPDSLRYRRRPARGYRRGRSAPTARECGPHHDCTSGRRRRRDGRSPRQRGRRSHLGSGDRCTDQRGIRRRPRRRDRVVGDVVELCVRGDRGRDRQRVRSRLRSGPTGQHPTRYSVSLDTPGTSASARNRTGISAIARHRGRFMRRRSRVAPVCCLCPCSPP